MRYLLLRLPIGSVRIPIRRALVLGRANDCDIVFDDGQVSRQHCRVTPTDRGVELIDLSAYGTRINDQPVNDRQELVAGDIIHVGPFRVVFAHVSDVHRPADDLDVDRVAGQMLVTLPETDEDEQSDLNRTTVKLPAKGFSSFLPVGRDASQIARDVARPARHVTHAVPLERLRDEFYDDDPVPPDALAQDTVVDPAPAGALAPKGFQGQPAKEPPPGPTLRIRAKNVPQPSTLDLADLADPTPTERIVVPTAAAASKPPLSPAARSPLVAHSTPPERVIDPSRKAKVVPPRRPSGEVPTGSTARDRADDANATTSNGPSKPPPAAPARPERREAGNTRERDNRRDTLPNEALSSSPSGRTKSFHEAATKLLDSADQEDEAMASTAQIPRPKTD